MALINQQNAETAQYWNTTKYPDNNQCKLNIEQQNIITVNIVKLQKSTSMNQMGVRLTVREPELACEEEKFGSRCLGKTLHTSKCNISMKRSLGWVNTIDQSNIKHWNAIA